MTDRERKLMTVQERPFNAETPLAELQHGITPAELFYVRSNFDVPAGSVAVPDADAWPVTIDGAIERPRVVTLGEIRRLPTVHVDATMECAGNGRRLMSPVPGGTPWGLGAVSTGRFTGAPLRDVLALCGALADGVIEIAFEAADEGAVDDTGAAQPIRFARSLPVAQALAPDTLLAWSLNDAPLAPDHGYPLRVFVPGWYGMASVKWVTRIRALTTPFEGHFQTDRYIYTGEAGTAEGTPVTRMRVRALILDPADGAIVTRATSAAAGSPDTVRVRGMAWSGFGAVSKVEISDDGGGTWHEAVVTPGASPYAASHWLYDWKPNGAGEHVLLARATDESGAVQPLEPVYNELGYGNNVVQRVTGIVKHEA